MTTPFLDKNYEGVPASASGYMKFQDGSSKFRVLSPAITGFEYWNDQNKPVRQKEMFQGQPTDIRLNDDGTASKIKHFWAMIVWNYEDERVQILQVNQATILRQVEAFINEPDLGDPRSYDIKVTREGQKLTTKYTIMALPPKDVPKEATEALKDTKINLQALYAGENPFESDTKVVSDEVAEDVVPF